MTEIRRPAARLTLAAVVASSAAVGGVALGQLVAADDPADVEPIESTEIAEPDPDEPETNEPTDDEPDPDAPADDEPADDEPPFGLPTDVTDAFEAFDECLQDVLGDEAFDELVPLDDVFDGEFGEWFPIDVGGPLVGDGGVLVDVGDGLPELYDFGDGDGSITITQADGEITVETTGDVLAVDDLLDEFDLPDLDLPDLDLPTDDEWDALWERFDAAHEQCADLLPDDAFVDVLPDLEELDLPDLEELDLPDLEEFDLPDLEEFDLPDLEELDLDELHDRLRDELRDLGLEVDLED